MLELLVGACWVAAFQFSRNCKPHPVIGIFGVSGLRDHGRGNRSFPVWPVGQSVTRNKRGVFRDMSISTCPISRSTGTLTPTDLHDSATVANIITVKIKRLLLFKWEEVSFLALIYFVLLFCKGIESATESGAYLHTKVSRKQNYHMLWRILFQVKKWVEIMPIRGAGMSEVMQMTIGTMCSDILVVELISCQICSQTLKSLGTECIFPWEIMENQIMGSETQRLHLQIHFSSTLRNIAIVSFFNSVVVLTVFFLALWLVSIYHGDDILCK